MDPIATPADLAVYLGLDEIDEERAGMLLADATALCQSVLSNLPSSAAGIVRRIAARAYSNPTSAQSASIGSASISYAATGTGSGVGGIYLSRSDKADLRRLGGGTGAFSINLLPPPEDDSDDS